MSYEVFTRVIDTDPDAQYPLGRHVSHDSRNLQYLAPADNTPASVTWTRHVGPLDQGTLGSCVGNAFAGLLATSPNYEAFGVAPVIDEPLAVRIYAKATVDDNVTGTYPPVDTGSTGKGGGQACKDLGFANGYLWAQGLDHFISAMQSGPVAVGTNWYNNMFTPDANGFVSIAKNDTIAGGHEYEFIELNLEEGWALFANSWGLGWGLNGYAKMLLTDLNRLFNEDGDATQLVPLTAPVPTPTPPPVPATHTTDSGLAKLLDPLMKAYPEWRSSHIKSPPPA